MSLWKNLNCEILLDILSFGSDKYKDTVNKEILVHTGDTRSTGVNSLFTLI